MSFFDFFITSLKPTFQDVRDITASVRAIQVARVVTSFDAGNEKGRDIWNSPFQPNQPGILPVALLPREGDAAVLLFAKLAESLQ